MAFSASTVPSNELTPLAADKPLFIGSNILTAYNALPQWRVSGSWASGSDITSSATRFGFDGHGHLQTFPTLSAGAQNYSYIMDLTEGTGNTSTLDCAMILNHNFYTLTATVTVYLEISDISDFSSSTTLATWTPGTADDRLISFSLNTNQRYVSVRYLRLRVNTSAGGGFVTNVPRFGELFAGRRYQMSYHPTIPWESKAERSEVVDFVPHSGAAVRYVRNYGQRFFDFTTKMHGSDANGLNQETQLRNFWQACRYGARPFVFVPNPTTAAQNAYLCHADPSMSMPILGPFERNLSLSFYEKAPFRTAEV